MDLVYTAYRGRQGSKVSPDWLTEGNTVCAVSSQNILLFATTTQLTDRESASWSSHVYCTDLNTPWEASLVTSLRSATSCLAWDNTGTRFVVSDTAGNVQIWSSRDGSLSDWLLVKSAEFHQENFVRAAFFPAGRPISLNVDKKDSVLYSDKFCHVGEGGDIQPTDGCLLVSSTGLLVVLVFPPDEPIIVASRGLGRGRLRIVHADMAVTREGQMVIATCGDTSPISVFAVHVVVDSRGCHDISVTAHSGFSLGPTPPQPMEPEEEEPVRIRALRFVLNECSDGLVVGTDGPEGGRVQMWSMLNQVQAPHRLFHQGGSPARQRVVPEWRYCEEFSGGGGRVVGLATPRSSVIGGASPSCYIAVAFADGSLQCLLRDSLQHIESVELPRSGNIAADSTKVSRVNVTICDLCFTASGNALVATDSLGQLYLYRMSPITDPGGPYSVSYIVTLLEYCLVSGRDFWDLAIATKPNRVEAVCEKLGENFSCQPRGLQQYYFARFMAIKSSLYRLISSSQYRAADTTALLMLHSIASTFKSLLRPSETSSPERGPSENLDIIIRSKCKDDTDVDRVVAALQSAGVAKDLSVDGVATLESLQHLSQWVTTLALHLVAGLPDYKMRRGPGYDLLHDQMALFTLRELLVMIRLWGVSRLPIITGQLWGGAGQQHGTHDLVAKLYSMVTRITAGKTDDEGLLDECLMLPSQVMIPPLDTVQSARGVLGAIHVQPAPLSYIYGEEPHHKPPQVTPFLEGLVYTEQPNSDFYFDSIQKIYLGKDPLAFKKCSRCCSITQANSTNGSSFNRSWEKRWNRNCTCGGSWKTCKSMT